jgi:hypothetical protein
VSGANVISQLTTILLALLTPPLHPDDDERRCAHTLDQSAALFADDYEKYRPRKRERMRKEQLREYFLAAPKDSPGVPWP